MLKETEEVFKHTDAFLSQFNLQNHQKIFNQLLDYAEKRKSDKEEEITQNIEKIFQRVCQINKAE